MEFDTFTKSYLVSALWSSIGDNDEPLDENYGIDDISQAAIDEAIRDCAAFQVANASLLNQAYTNFDGSKELSNTNDYGEAMAGHDFWLTRNGHGAGFWDRGLDDVGDQLTDAAKSFGDYDLYVGDDGKIYGAASKVLNTRDILNGTKASILRTIELATKLEQSSALRGQRLIVLDRLGRAFSKFDDCGVKVKLELPRPDLVGVSFMDAGEAKKATDCLEDSFPEAGPFEVVDFHDYAREKIATAQSMLVTVEQGIAAAGNDGDDKSPGTPTMRG